MCNPIAKTRNWIAVRTVADGHDWRSQVIESVLEWYRDGVRTTIDKAGRVVIPSAIRERARLTPGAELEITEDETGVRLERVAPAPRLVKVGRRLVARPTLRADARTPLDLAA